MKNKKNLFFIIMFACVLLIGSTIAYYTSYDTFSNLFKASSYTVEVQETFESPDNWLPGDTTPKTVIATNKGETKVAVRIKLTPSWEDSEGNSLPLVDSHDNPGAIINFNENLNEKWTYEDGYYYYNLPLEANESTTSLMESVTFNPDFEIGGTTECTTDEVTHKESCITTLSGYSGGKYKLLIEVETCQYDHYPEIWPTGVPIAEPDSLYNVLMNASNEGTYAAEYTDAHHDSFTVEPTKKIYYYHADNDTEGVAIYNQNNVLFAGQCWQMIRTTDTGGVKLLYNGVADNNKCLSTREPTYGIKDYGTISQENYHGTYYYADNFVYDKTTNTFKLSGNIFSHNFNYTNEDFINIKDKYTCIKINADATCSTLYKVDTFNGTSYTTQNYSKNTQYYSIGLSRYNNPYNSDSYAGYMYNKIYPYLTESVIRSINVASTNRGSVSGLYFSDSVVWNVTNNCWVLANPELGFANSSKITSSEVDAIQGKYMASGTTSCASYVYSASIYSNNQLSRTTIELGTDSTCTNHPCTKYYFTLGQSYQLDSLGTATIDNSQTISAYDWLISDFDYTGYYFCEGKSPICDDLRVISTSTTSSTVGKYVSYQNIYKYANSFDYIDGKYYLKDFSSSSNVQNDPSILNHHHYTCFNNTGVCDKAYYIFHEGTNANMAHYIFYIRLSDGEGINEVEYNSFHADDVNSKDSRIKRVVDLWYKDNLQNYNSYLEDVVFCNNRSLSTPAGYNANGGDVNARPIFGGNGLTCSYITDKFSVNNPKAQLTYPIGLLTGREYNLLNYNPYKTTFNRDHGFWLLAPSFVYYSVDSTGFSSNGGINTSVGHYAYGTDNVSWLFGVRPVVSLKPGTMYVSGNGTMEYPYVIR